jgi:superfamily II DNA helicase RecQ
MDLDDPQQAVREQRIAVLLGEIAQRDNETRRARGEIAQLESDAAAAVRSRQEVVQESAHKRFAADTFPWDGQVDACLARLGIPSFREPQRAVVNCALSRQDCFVIMPTGGGKSLCYQLPAMLAGGADGSGADDTAAGQPLTIVISPLVSLMADQVAQMKQAGIAAEQVTSLTSKEEQRRIYTEVSGPSSNRSFRLLYVTPERVVQSGRFKGVLQKCQANSGSRIDRFVIDEAHCISKYVFSAPFFLVS